MTVQRLREYLNQFGWNNYEITEQPSEQEGYLSVAWYSQPNGDRHVLLIDPIVEKSLLIFQISNIINIRTEINCEHAVGELAQFLMFLNHKIDLGKFTLDPSDGSVHFFITIPIDKNEVTYEQFVHCIRVSIELTEVYYDSLKALCRRQRTLEALIAEVETSIQNQTRIQLAEELEQLLVDMQRAQAGNHENSVSS